MAFPKKGSSNPRLAALDQLDSEIATHSLKRMQSRKKKPAAPVEGSPAEEAGESPAEEAAEDEGKRKGRVR